MAESILVSLAKSGTDISTLEKKASKYYLPLINIIKQSPITCNNVTQSWEYKSIAQAAIEGFCKYEPSHKIDADENDILLRLSHELSNHIRSWTFYMEEGLRVFIKDGNSYKQATIDDEDYAFVTRLTKENLVWDIVYVEPPQWAKNLYLNSRAYEVYSWFYHSDFESSKFDLLKQVKSDAIARILDDENDRFITTEKPLIPKERDNLYRIIAALSEILLNENSSDNAKPHLKNQSKLIEYLERQYDGYGGLSKANLEKILPIAKKLLSPS